MVNLVSSGVGLLALIVCNVPPRYFRETDSFALLRVGPANTWTFEAVGWPSRSVNDKQVLQWSMQAEVLTVRRALVLLKNSGVGFFFEIKYM